MVRVSTALRFTPSQKAATSINQPAFILILFNIFSHLYCETTKALRKTADELLPAFLRKKAAFAKSGETYHTCKDWRLCQNYELDSCMLKAINVLFGASVYDSLAAFLNEDEYHATYQGDKNLKVPTAERAARVRFNQVWYKSLQLCNSLPAKKQPLLRTNQLHHTRINSAKK